MLCSTWSQPECPRIFWPCPAIYLSCFNTADVCSFSLHFIVIVPCLVWIPLGSWLGATCSVRDSGDKSCMRLRSSNALPTQRCPSAVLGVKPSLFSDQRRFGSASKICSKISKGLDVTKSVVNTMEIGGKNKQGSFQRYFIIWLWIWEPLSEQMKIGWDQ